MSSNLETMTIDALSPQISYYNSSDWKCESARNSTNDNLKELDTTYYNLTGYRLHHGKQSGQDNGSAILRALGTSFEVIGFSAPRSKQNPSRDNDHSGGPPNRQALSYKINNSTFAPCQYYPGPPPTPGLPVTLNATFCTGALTAGITNTITISSSGRPQNDDMTSWINSFVVMGYHPSSMTSLPTTSESKTSSPTSSMQSSTTGPTATSNDTSPGAQSSHVSTGYFVTITTTSIRQLTGNTTSPINPSLSTPTFREPVVGNARHGEHNTVIIASTIGTVLLLVSLTIAFLFWRHYRKRRTATQARVPPSQLAGTYSYSDSDRSTDSVGSLDDPSALENLKTWSPEMFTADRSQSRSRTDRLLRALSDSELSGTVESEDASASDGHGHGHGTGTGAGVEGKPGQMGHAL